MEHRISCLEHNIRTIMNYLHLEYKEPCKATYPQCVASTQEQTSKGEKEVYMQSVHPTISTVQFFSPNAAAALVDQAKSQVRTTNRKKFVPVEDGFITTAGNKELGAMYGNTTGSNRIGG